MTLQTAVAAVVLSRQGCPATEHNLDVVEQLCAVQLEAIRLLVARLPDWALERPTYTA